jgi:hypothetical protein
MGFILLMVSIRPGEKKGYPKFERFIITGKGIIIG